MNCQCEHVCVNTSRYQRPLSFLVDSGQVNEINKSYNYTSHHLTCPSNYSTLKLLLGESHSLTHQSPTKGSLLLMVSPSPSTVQERGACQRRPSQSSSCLHFLDSDTGPPSGQLWHLVRGDAMGSNPRPLEYKAHASPTAIP